MQAALQSRGMGYQGPLFELRRYSRPESGRGEAMTDGKLRKTVYGRRSRFDVLEVHSPLHAPSYDVHKNGEFHGGPYPDLRAAVFAAREDAWREYWGGYAGEAMQRPSPRRKRGFRSPIPPDSGFRHNDEGRPGQSSPG